MLWVLSFSLWLGPLVMAAGSSYSRARGWGMNSNYRFHREEPTISPLIGVRYHYRCQWNYRKCRRCRSKSGSRRSPQRSAQERLRQCETRLSRVLIVLPEESRRITLRGLEFRFEENVPVTSNGHTFWDKRPSPPGSIELLLGEPVVILHNSELQVALDQL